MKILYGVQGTGNGHISRSHGMAEAFARHADVRIDWLFSGRPKAQLQDEKLPFSWRRGLTFHTRNGKIHHLDTILRNNAFVFLRDVARLDLAGYDLVISDFEPVVSWAALRQGRECVGIGHQYAFHYAIPRARDFLGEIIMRRFAPANLRIGLHWHHFDQPIFPPIINVSPDQAGETVPNKVIVYMPFEDLGFQQALLAPLTDHEFYIYSQGAPTADEGNIHLRPTSRTHFKADLLSAAAIICNTGFELISEALMLGKRILTRPLQQQVEQMSNALALERLDYAKVVYRLRGDEIKAWLNEDAPALRIHYPDVAGGLADWLVGGDRTALPEFAEQLWSKVTVESTAAGKPERQEPPGRATA